jgi:hypothetical protein
MKTFFAKTFCLSIVLVAALLAGCQNPIAPPEQAALPRGQGRVVVNIDAAAGGGAPRTLGPEASKYTLEFEGPAEQAPVEIIGGNSVSLDLEAGSWTISVTGFAITEDTDTPIAQGEAELEVREGDNGELNILLNPLIPPQTGGPNGSFRYALTLVKLGSTDIHQLRITTAEGKSVKTISLLTSSSTNIVSGLLSLAPGEYRAQVQICIRTHVSPDVREARYIGLTEVFHIYSGLTTTLERTLRYDEFLQTVTEFDLTSMVTAPAAWAAPVRTFSNVLGIYNANTPWNEVNWTQSDGSPLAGSVFLAGTVYKAVLTLQSREGWTVLGVPENSFTHTGATSVVNAEDSGIVTITFPATDSSPVVTGVTVTPASPVIGQGGQARFSAAVTGAPPDPPQTVSWTVIGAESAGTSITAGAGVLTVATNETAPTLTVRAAPDADPAQYGETTVTVTPVGYVEIDTVAKLKAINMGGKYRLAADLTLTDWIPLGSAAAPFTGIFDGNGRTITLKSFSPTVLSGVRSEPYVDFGVGIFGYVQGTSPTSSAELKNLTINYSPPSDAGSLELGQGSLYDVFFGLLTGYAENVGISGITLSGSDVALISSVSVGGIAGRIKNSVLENCSVNVNMNMYIFAVGNDNRSVLGGFAGSATGTAIRNCHNTGSITATTKKNFYCGGIVGFLDDSSGALESGTIEQCSYAGIIAIGTESGANGTLYVGGIAGAVSGNGSDSANPTRITECRAGGTISGDVSPTYNCKCYVGGIAGEIRSRGLIARSCFNGTAIANNTGENLYSHGANLAPAIMVGGIAGSNADSGGRIEDCWSHGDILGFNIAGGIVGTNNGAAASAYIHRCYSTARVTRTGLTNVSPTVTYVNGAGGIAGINTSGDDALKGCAALNPEISSGQGENFHRVLGYMDSGSTDRSLSNNYAWSGMTMSPGSGTYAPDIGADKVDGANTVTQPNQAFYQGLGWDFAAVWEMDASGYPKLQWQ